MLNKLNDIKYSNNNYIYEYSVEPNSFSKVLDIVTLNSNKKTKTINKITKDCSSSICDIRDNHSKVNIVDRINLHNTLRKFR